VLARTDQDVVLSFVVAWGGTRGAEHGGVVRAALRAATSANIVISISK
jgi:hypothetical protein